LASFQGDNLVVKNTTIQGSRLTLADGTVTFGSAMAVQLTPLLLDRVTVRGCNNSMVGAVVIVGDANAPPILATIVDSVIESNNATNAGGIFVIQAPLTLKNVIIRNNTADGNFNDSSCGGLGIQSHDRTKFPTTFLGRIEISGNRATGAKGIGGGITMDTQASLYINTTNVSIFGNKAALGDGIFSSVNYIGDSYGIFQINPPQQEWDAGSRLNITDQVYFSDPKYVEFLVQQNVFANHNIPLDSDLAQTRGVLLSSQSDILNDYMLPPVQVIPKNGFGMPLIKTLSSFPCVLQMELEAEVQTGEKQNKLVSLLKVFRPGYQKDQYVAEFKNISLAAVEFPLGFTGKIFASFKVTSQNEFALPGDQVKEVSDGTKQLSFTLIPERCGSDDCVRIATSFVNGRYYYTAIPKLRVSDSVRILFFVVSIVLIVVAIIFGVYAHIHRELKIYKVTSPFFTNLITFGCIMQLLSIALRGFFKPSQATMYPCMATEWLELIGFILVGGSIILKTFRIQAIFINTLKTRGRADSITNELLSYWLALFLVITVAFLTTWQLKGRLEVLDLNFKGLTEDRQRFLLNLVHVGGISGWIQTDKCVSKDDASFFSLLSVIIHLVVVVVAAYYAFICRTVPAQYNETKTMLLISYSWLLSSGVLFPLGEYLMALPTQAFVIQTLRIIAPVALTLFLLHVPRVYVVAFHPSQAGSKGSTFGTGGSNKKSTNHSSNKGSTDKLSHK